MCRNMNFTAPLLLLHLAISEFQLENPPPSFPLHLLGCHYWFTKLRKTQNGVLRKTPCQLHPLKTAYLFILCMLSKYMQLWSSKNVMGLHHQEKSCHLNCQWASHLGMTEWRQSDWLWLQDDIRVRNVKCAFVSEAIWISSMYHNMK